MSRATSVRLSDTTYDAVVRFGESQQRNLTNAIEYLLNLGLGVIGHERGEEFPVHVAGRGGDKSSAGKVEFDGSVRAEGSDKVSDSAVGEHGGSSDFPEYVQVDDFEPEPPEPDYIESIRPKTIPGIICRDCRNAVEVLEGSGGEKYICVGPQTHTMSKRQARKL